MKKIVIWVEARKGLGHFKVAAALTRALEQTGCEVHVATSRPQSFDFFYSGRNAEVKEGFKEFNWERLPSPPKQSEQHFLHLLQSVQPDAVIFEMWPMRRAVFDERILNGLQELKKLNPNARVFSLVREVYGERPFSKNKRHKEAASLIQKCIDTVLVRGDGQIALHETWPDMQPDAFPIAYAGYFGAPSSNRNSSAPTAEGDWVVGMGGGWFNQGTELAEIISQCHQDQAEPGSVCKLFLPTDQLEKLDFMHNGRVKIQGIGAEFPRSLPSARLAVIQAGYNSLVETLDLGVPAVFFAARNDFTSGEQSFRLKRFEELGIIGGDSPWQILDDFSPIALEKAISASLKGKARPSGLIFDGAKRAAEIICEQI